MQIVKILVGAINLDIKDVDQKWFKVLIYVDEDGTHYKQSGSLLLELSKETSEELLENHRIIFGK